MNQAAQSACRTASCAAPFALLMLAVFSLVVACSSDSGVVTIRVVNADSNTPVPGAMVVTSGELAHTDDNGMVRFAKPPSQLLVRAAGYRHVELEGTAKATKGIVVHLQPMVPKALYLSVYGVGNERLRQSALKLIKETELNALVIDVKGDRGHIPYRSGVALARKVGAQQLITVPDIASFVASLHAQGIYAIARVVTFKDDKLARAHAEWAVHTRDGNLWIDHEGLAWSDPFRPEVWEYNLDIAEEAVRLGFDEIQFDYLRFPDEAGLVFSKASTEKNRVGAITGFLSAARKRLEPYNVPIAADLFGYTLWNTDDTKIGQRLEDMAPVLDYISPMLYPSAFQFGIPGYADPVAHPYEIASLSLRLAQQRTGLSATHFRPWLQAFRDYAFGHSHYGGEQIAAQIRAAEEFGSNGWMLWNPRNVYTANGLKKKAEKP